MIKREDLLDAIAECQGQKDPNANTCIKLAAYYTILDHLDDREDERLFLRSYAPPPFADQDNNGTINYNGGSEFADLISDLPQAAVWPVIDELMGTIKALHPRLYDGVMRKLDGLH